MPNGRQASAGPTTQIMKVLLETKNLVKEYKLGGEEVHALRSVSLKINEGEMVAIIGPSGSGKSTLMHILGGLDRPDSGEVFVDGENLSKLSQRKLAEYRNKKIGFIFQTFNLQPDLTATENVELPLVIAGKGSRERKKLAQEALEKVGLKDRVKHKPNELSGGQRQRVSIARALVNSPKIIFADEPTGNLDTKTGANVLALLKKLNQEDGVTLIIVTHDDEIASACDRVIKMRDGEIMN